MQGKKGHRAHGQSRKGAGEGRAVQGEAGIAENAGADSRDEVAAGHSYDGQDHGGDKALQGKAEREFTCRGAQRRRVGRGVAHGVLG